MDINYLIQEMRDTCTVIRDVLPDQRNDLDLCEAAKVMVFRFRDLDLRLSTSGALPADWSGAVHPAPVAGGNEWQRTAREAGWLPPDEVEFRVWRAHNLEQERCRWCRAVRFRWHGGMEPWWQKNSGPQPHRTGCRFFSGPVTHGHSGGYQGSFGYWMSCLCGANYPAADPDGRANECPDIGLTHREPRMPDMTQETP